MKTIIACTKAQIETLLLAQILAAADDGNALKGAELDEFNEMMERNKLGQFMSKAELEQKLAEMNRGISELSSAITQGAEITADIIKELVQNPAFRERIGLTAGAGMAQVITKLSERVSEDSAFTLKFQEIQRKAEEKLAAQYGDDKSPVAQAIRTTTLPEPDENTGFVERMEFYTARYAALQQALESPDKYDRKADILAKVARATLPITIGITVSTGLELAIPLLIGAEMPTLMGALGSAAMNSAIAEAIIRGEDAANIDNPIIRSGLELIGTTVASGTIKTGIGLIKDKLMIRNRLYDIEDLLSRVSEGKGVAPFSKLNLVHTLQEIKGRKTLQGQADYIENNVIKHIDDYLQQLREGFKKAKKADQIDRDSIDTPLGLDGWIDRNKLKRESPAHYTDIEARIDSFTEIRKRLQELATRSRQLQPEMDDFIDSLLSNDGSAQGIVKANNRSQSLGKKLAAMRHDILQLDQDYGYVYPIYLSDKKRPPAFSQEKAMFHKGKDQINSIINYVYHQLRIHSPLDSDTIKSDNLLKYNQLLHKIIRKPMPVEVTSVVNQVQDKSNTVREYLVTSMQATGINQQQKIASVSSALDQILDLKILDSIKQQIQLSNTDIAKSVLSKIESLEQQQQSFAQFLRQAITGDITPEISSKLESMINEIGLGIQNIKPDAVGDIKDQLENLQGLFLGLGMLIDRFPG